MLSFPPFRLDLTDERLWKDGKELRLRRKPFAILRYLADHPRRLVTHEELVEAVWGKTVMSDSVLRSHIRALRQVLGPEIVETVVGRGYRFLVDVREIDASSQPGVPVASAPMVDARRSALVGRVAELAALRAALESSREGMRQLIFVTGEAGVGKTTLVDAFLEHVASDGTVSSAHESCVEQYGSGEAYLPVLAALGHLCRSPEGERVVDVLSRHAPTWLVQMPALVTGDRAEELRRRIVAATQGRMLRELAEALEVLSMDRMVVLTLDDLHWSDPSTVELLAMLGRRREAGRLLMIGTYRPTELAKIHPLTKVVGELVAHRQATHLPLETFSEETVAEYVDKRFAGHSFPGELAGTVYRTTGGNPLFVVTLFDDLERRQTVRPVDGRWELTTSIEDVAARRPDSIRRLLDVQFDRLDVTEQRIVEAASVAGNTFAAGVVAHALEMPVDAVDSTCETLANEHRFLRYLGTETWPDGTVQSRYGFAHALYQHAALARTHSVRRWHRRIAERLEAGHADQTDAIAAELAVHFGEGHVFARAAHYEVLAGERASRRHEFPPSASTRLIGGWEALGHFERARAHIAQFSEGRERDELELRVLHGLGPCFFTVKAPDAPEVAQAFTRAAELASRLGRDEELCAALIGLQERRISKGDLRALGEHGDELTLLTRRMANPSLRDMASFLLTCGLFYQGRLSEAETGFRQICSDFDAGGRSLTPAVVWTQGILALLAWLRGRPDEAIEWGGASASAADKLGDPFTLAATHCIAGVVQAWRRDAARALECGQRVLDIANEERMARWQSLGNTLVQWASSELDPAPSPVRLDALIADPWQTPFDRGLHTLAVELSARAGRHLVALEKISVTMDRLEQTDERWVEPEFHRLRGELLKSTDQREAERSFTKAIEVARHQSARSFELRAAMSLYRFQGGAKKKEALEDVRRVFETFTEGFETGDLLDAKAILAE